jgi:hypothetical protein
MALVEVVDQVGKALQVRRQPAVLAAAVVRWLCNLFVLGVLTHQVTRSQ